MTYTAVKSDPIDHAAQALRHVEAAKAARLALTDEYAKRDQDRARIGDLHQTIGFALKVAEIHALLANVPETTVHAEFLDDHLADDATVQALRAERFGTGSRLA